MPVVALLQERIAQAVVDIQKLVNADAAVVAGARAALAAIAAHERRRPKAFAPGKEAREVLLVGLIVDFAEFADSAHQPLVQYADERGCNHEAIDPHVD